MKTLTREFAELKPRLNIRGGKNGVPSYTTTSKLKPHRFLQLTDLEKPQHGQKIVELYGSGHSLKEIATTLRKSHEAIRAHLENAGILPPIEKSSVKPTPIAPKGKVRWNSPYGFKYERGQAVRHPQEFETLRIIMRLRKSGLNAREIADRLNKDKLRPRTAKRWDRCTVHRIIEWHQKHPTYLQEETQWVSTN